MRPRVFPAEDGAAVKLGGESGFASMRPRVFPAEDAATGSKPDSRTTGFNEAAGIPRGRQPERYSTKVELDQLQ